MKISIFGLGYVGCTGIACLSNGGFEVIGVDKSEHKVNQINQGKPTIIEKDIDELIQKGFDEGRISATYDYTHAVLETDISIIAVGTPSTYEGHLNLEYIYKVSEEIGSALRNKKEFHVVVIRSTVLPGTNLKVGKIIESASGMKRGLHFDVVSNPEFLREGSAVNDYYHPPVTVIGSSNEKAIQITTELYKDLPAPIKIVSIEVAEFIKYVNNSWHALKITFANEVGNICKRLKIDSHEVMDLFVMDKQLNLSDYYLKPGFAYGGSCLPKDLKGLQTIAHDNYLKSPVLSSIERSNELQKRIAIDMIEKYNKKKLGIIGLSFKKGTDDLRYSPIVEVAEYFLGKGYSIKVYDKYINMSKLTGTNLDYINKQIPHLSGMITDNLNEVIQDAEIVVINHNISDIEPLIDKHKDVFFIDLVKVSERKHTNCEGICW